MLFNRLAIKLLRQENSRLRAEVRRRDTKIDELLDRFVHNRAPERLVSRSVPDRQSVPLQANDSYGAAMEDAERLAEKERLRHERDWD